MFYSKYIVLWKWEYSEWIDIFSCFCLDRHFARENFINLKYLLYLQKYRILYFMFLFIINDKNTESSVMLLTAISSVLFFYFIYHCLLNCCFTPL